LPKAPRANGTIKGGRKEGPIHIGCMAAPIAGGLASKQMQFQCGNSNEPEVVRRWEHLKFYYAHKGGSGGWPNYTQAHIEYKTIYRQLIQSEEAIW